MRAKRHVDIVVSALGRIFRTSDSQDVSELTRTSAIDCALYMADLVGHAIFRAHIPENSEEGHCLYGILATRGRGGGTAADLMPPTAAPWAASDSSAPFLCLPKCLFFTTKLIFMTLFI